ncbi:hypothetical protein SAMN05421860_11720 [Streptomyces microflavus]|nr:hypothetical protein SAMN05421860_11720 [Streptomyces microflavus]
MSFQSLPERSATSASRNSAPGWPAAAADPSKSAAVDSSKALGIAPARIHRDRYAAVSELRGELRAFIRDGHRKKTRRTKKDR